MQTLVYWLAKAIVAAIQSLPLDFVARCGRAGGAIAHAIDARHRTVALTNLRRCFPEKAAREIESIAREHFKRLGETYACGIKTSSMTFEQISTRCEVVGAEKLAMPQNASSNRIVAIGHFGNFELYTILARCVRGFRGAATYRGLKQPGLNRVLEELRNRSGCLFFERRSGLRELTRALSKRDVLLGLLGDQHGGPKGVWGPFFGMECSTNPAPAVFALRYDSPLNTAICYRIGLARWRMEIGDPIPLFEAGHPRSVEAIMRDVNAAFETAIRRDPANWFWVHKRWKPRGVPPK
jgi:lauroyl/myristoyl acyltransferase